MEEAVAFLGAFLEAFGTVAAPYHIEAFPPYRSPFAPWVAAYQDIPSPSGGEDVHQIEGAPYLLGYYALIRRGFGVD